MTENTPRSQSSDDTLSGAISVIVVIITLLIVAVNALVPDPRWRTVVYVVISAIPVIGLAIYLRRYGTVALFTNFVVLCLICAIPLLPIVLYAPDERVVLLKGGALLVLALLPGSLYLHFIATKGKTLQEEYILNLYRLHVDDYRNLPEPPRSSLFYERWKTSGGEQSAVGEQSAGNDAAPQNLYLRKFQAVYGMSTGTLSRENLSPVLFMTLLLAIGWAGVLQPEVILGLHFPIAVKALDLPALPREALSFGFVGTYFFILQMLLRRYFQDDLKTSAYINATIRIMTVAFLVIAVDVIWPWSPVQMKAFAFLMGIFPQIGLQVLQTLLTYPLRWLIPNLHTDYPLSDLDGLNVWYESRLLEEGIEDMQNLATANLVDFMLRTRVPMDRLIDWIDQAYLYLHVRNSETVPTTDGKRGPAHRETLRRLGIRTATDLQNACARPVAEVSQTAEQQAGVKFANRLRRVLNPATDDDQVSVVETILKALENEPNLYHIRKWKDFTVELKCRSWPCHMDQ